MKNFTQKMPLGLNILYAFAWAARQNVLCTRMGCESETRSNYSGSHMAYNYTWFEARPVPGETNLYIVSKHQYSRHNREDLTGDHVHRSWLMHKAEPSTSTGVYYTRDEAIGLLATLEKQMLSSANVCPVTGAPVALRALSIHRSATKALPSLA